MASQEEEKELFPVGTRIILQGLESFSRLNGKEAVVTSKPNKGGRRQVCLTDNEDGEEEDSKNTFAVRPQNMRIAPRLPESLTISEMKIVFRECKYDESLTRGMEKKDMQVALAELCTPEQTAQLLVEKQREREQEQEEAAAMEEEAVSIRHRGVVCDGCKTTGFNGPRYHCLICEDLDLCEGCFKSGIQPSSHKIEHQMMRILSPRHIFLYNDNTENRHYNIVCDGCGKENFQGTARVCAECNADLCADCFAANKEPGHHLTCHDTRCLRPFYSSIMSSSKPHEGVHCDVCHKENFCGYRYYCVECQDYDLCGSCFIRGAKSQSHSPRHCMERLWSPDYLELAELNNEAQIHFDVICDGCEKEYFPGLCHACADCGINFCEGCYEANKQTGKHNLAHDMRLLTPPVITDVDADASEDTPPSIPKSDPEEVPSVPGTVMPTGSNAQKQQQSAPRAQPHSNEDDCDECLQALCCCLCAILGAVVVGGLASQPQVSNSYSSLPIYQTQPQVFQPTPTYTQSMDRGMAAQQMAYNATAAADQIRQSRERLRDQMHHQMDREQQASLDRTRAARVGGRSSYQASWDRMNDTANMMNENVVYSHTYTSDM